MTAKVEILSDLEYIPKSCWCALWLTSCTHLVFFFVIHPFCSFCQWSTPPCSFPPWSLCICLPSAWNKCTAALTPFSKTYWAFSSIFSCVISSVSRSLGQTILSYTPIKLMPFLFSSFSHSSLYCKLLLVSRVDPKLREGMAWTMLLMGLTTIPECILDT